MITLTKSGNAIVFTFDDNDHYLNDGTIEVPVNSLTLVTDESQMATFRKAASNDVFISARYDELGMSKSDLESWFKTNACSTGGGGGGGGVTSGWVENYVEDALVPYAESSAVTEEISEAVSGKADTSDVQNIASDVATVSGDVNTLSGSVNALTGNVNTISGDVATLSGSVESLHTAVTDVVGDVQTLSGDVANKADTTAVTASITAAVSGKADASDVYTKTEVDDALDDKQDTLSAGTGISIVDNVISATGGGGGKAIVAGRGIAVTTGETADTVSFNLPISAGTGVNSLILGYDNATERWKSKATANGAIASGVGCSAMTNSSFALGYDCKTQGAGGEGNFAQGYSTTASGKRCHSEGLSTTASADASHSEGNRTTASGNYSHSEGEQVTATNIAEHSQGRYNISNKANNTFGDSGNTLFSVGNGTADNARHNAFEIRQNGDIYITKDGSDVKLQDQLGGGVDSGTVQSMIDDSLENYYDADTIDTQLYAIKSAITATTDRIERVTATALNDLNAKLGGMKLVQLTQAQYDALTVKDNQTLYIITNVVN